MSDEHRIAVNEESEMLVGTEESVLSGYLFSNSDSELNFSGNAAWLAHAGSVIIWDDYAGSSRVLSASEYKIESGKVKIKKGCLRKRPQLSSGNSSGGLSLHLYVEQSHSDLGCFLYDIPYRNEIRRHYGKSLYL
ncbi:hypothetical protein [Cohnella rhizosphaerae]|uniref:Uncharacterized protein n=1 Tax=Cohnella rhizosphaerae TaxID=1457232 RepID=A0A9X4KUL7_9BACL|nr:hypothetical protein [Cohnella rhizosphaerae]MDG0811416.1 hypothetical protein [Cohnella rhizosphaerae]